MATIQRPEAILRTSQVITNIDAMATKAKRAGVALRPHFKTHQSIPIGRWFRDAGVTGITVSTPEMAAYFADDGWEDITIAFPFYPNQIQQINHLAEKISLRLFINSPDQITYLEKNLDYPVAVYIEADAGYGRSGVSVHHQTEVIDAIVQAATACEKVHLHGFYFHDGDTYRTGSAEKIIAVAERNYNAAGELKRTYPDLSICLGDTPSCSVMDSFPHVDEISPGNFVFFDLTQVVTGSCAIEEVALFIEAPVAQIQPDKDRAILHCGAVHCSKDLITIPGGHTVYGVPVWFDEHQKPHLVWESYLSSLSQEHGVLEHLSAAQKAITDRNTIMICPAHSCLTANLFKEYRDDQSGQPISKRILS
ncbi:MAG: alanine racemase [Balneolaceae bacterium]